MNKEEIEAAQKTLAESLGKINLIEKKISEFQEQYKKLLEMRKKGLNFCASTLKKIPSDMRDECLAETDPKLAAEIKKSMFLFTDLAKLDRRELQKILFKCKTKDIAYAVKLLDGTEVKKHIVSNISKNNLQEVHKYENEMGEKEIVDRNECAAAQKVILDIAYEMIESGEISCPEDL